MSETTAPRALLAAPEKTAPPPSELIVQVARTYGVSPFKQFGQMVRLWAGKNRMEFAQYYKNAVYRKDLSAEEKRQFVGERGSRLLNDRLSPRSITQQRAFVRDKVFYGAMMDQLGFPTPRIQAVASGHRTYGSMTTLTDAHQIEQFLLNDAAYPLFVKPEEGSGSVGSALINDIDKDARELVLSNGMRIDLHAFATEAMEDYAAGLLFQDAVIQHPTMSDMAGQAVGTIRVVTIIQDDTPEVLYTLWKVPSPNAMSDNYWQSGSMIAEIDKASGILQQCRRGAGPEQEMVETHPVSKQTFPGMQIPHWDEVLRVTTEGHMLFPQFGVFGWDIAITKDGPVIIECNANPHHMLYQLTTGRGILNADFAPILKKVEDRGQDIRCKEREKVLQGIRDGH
ncbi:MAG: sugar-transfer associated ATP-grasp domain-containing protein [Roseovarius sp.]